MLLGSGFKLQRPDGDAKDVNHKCCVGWLLCNARKCVKAFSELEGTLPLPYIHHQRADDWILCTQWCYPALIMPSKWRRKWIIRHNENISSFNCNSSSFAVRCWSEHHRSLVFLQAGFRPEDHHNPQAKTFSHTLFVACVMENRLRTLRWEDTRLQEVDRVSRCWRPSVAYWKRTISTSSKRECEAMGAEYRWIQRRCVCCPTLWTLYLWS